MSGAMNMVGAFAGAAGMTRAGYLLQGGREELLFILFAGSYGLVALCWLLADVTKTLLASAR